MGLGVEQIRGMSKEINWIFDRADNWDTLELDPKEDGCKGRIRYYSFKGNLPYRMITALRKQLNSHNDGRSHASYTKQFDDDTHVCARLPCYKGDSSVHVTFDVTEIDKWIDETKRWYDL